MGYKEHHIKKRLYLEAHCEGTQLNSVGEIDAITPSLILGVTPGEVLYDPKLRVPGGYQHPALRQLFDMTLDEQINLMLSRKGRYRFFPKLAPPTLQPGSTACMSTG